MTPGIRALWLCPVSLQATQPVFFLTVTGLVTNQHEFTVVKLGGSLLRTLRILRLISRPPLGELCCTIRRFFSTRAVFSHGQRNTERESSVAMPEDYPKGVLVAGGGPLEQHWALTSERQRQDRDARIAWAQVHSLPP